MSHTPQVNGNRKPIIHYTVEVRGGGGNPKMLVVNAGRLSYPGRGLSNEEKKILDIFVESVMQSTDNQKTK